MLTDDALASSVGVRMGFTGRAGGVSSRPFASLNLGSHVGDVLSDVEENRRRVLSAVGYPTVPIIAPNQVHGIAIVTIDDAGEAALADVREKVADGADSLLVSVPQVAAMLCYADCVPVVLVAPDGHFCVAHAGWRGAVAGIVGASLSRLCEDGTDPFEVNLYVGPHIHAECFEVSEEIATKFAETYGRECVPDARRVSLYDAVRLDALTAGANPERIVEAGICTQCHPQTYFSYRASGGVCGRHGAFAVRDK